MLILKKLLCKIQETSDYIADKEELFTLAKEYGEDDTVYQDKIRVI